MKYLITYIAIMLTLFTVAQNKTNVLFIGNSITYYNDMPQTFKAIADSKGDSVNLTVYAPGGTGFINHVDDANVYNYFRQGNWDYIVLQPGSNESPGYSETIEATLIRARKLQDSIIEYNPCCKILYYEISYGVWGNTQENLNTYNETMGLIKSNLTYLADSTQLYFAPAGEAIKTAWNNDTNTMLWGGAGNIHPNEKGSYIIACSFYSSIFQKESFGTNVFSTLTQQEAETYQLLVDTTVLNHLSDWRINTFNQFTDFNYVINQNEVSFTSLSNNIDSLKWDFGDYNYSNQANITHNYLQDGNYTVELTSYNKTCTETVSDTIIINTTTIKDINNIIFNIFPNPVKDIINIKTVSTKQNLLLQILNISGQILIHINIDSYQTNIDLSSFENGIYLLQIINDNKIIITKKIIKK